ncbi:hypothetical protein [Stutzerimonas tarimensis]|uniref:Uncharacterized protein n=1 Tax=Stutzerimonas tarimensis TaxID=1507735 RepID=A0ABV7T4J2_9GAMM
MSSGSSSSRLTAALAALMLCSTGALATDQGDPPFIVGVSSHLLHTGDPSGRADRLIRDAGIVSVRDDAHWAFVERERMQLHIEPHWFGYLRRMERRGLNSMFILGYGNRFHGGGEKPRTDRVRAAFGRYVEHVVRELRGRIEYYEVWNEWDMNDADDPASTRDYAQLVAESAARIRRHDPNAKILAGAVTTRGIESGFAHRLIDNGVMQVVDGFSLHPYVHCRRYGRHTPEAWIDWLGEVSASLSREAGRPVPLYLTEMSWPAHQGRCGIDDRLQAAYLARSYFLARTLPSIKGMWWYGLRNDGQDPTEREHNFGLLTYDFEPKPAYHTLSAISTVVANYRYLGREPGETGDVQLLRFASDKRQLLVAWSTGEPVEVSVTSDTPTGRLVRLTDTEQPQRGPNRSESEWNCPGEGAPCTARVTLTEFPKLIVLSDTGSARDALAGITEIP